MANELLVFLGKISRGEEVRKHGCIWTQLMCVLIGKRNAKTPFNKKKLNKTKQFRPTFNKWNTKKPFNKKPFNKRNTKKLRLTFNKNKTKKTLFNKKKLNK